MVRVVTNAVALLLLCLPAVVSSAQRGFQEPSPPFSGDRIPTPPNQLLPWDPPETRFPANYIAAIELLFEQGFADPRGCEYREVEVGSGSCWWGDGGVVRTRGWVLPSSDKIKPNFAVCWNGLVYPIISAGEKHSYVADVNRLIEVDEAERKKFEKQHPDRKYYRIRRRVVSEATIVSYESLLPIKILPLLRLGEAELAEKLHLAWIRGNTSDLADLAKDVPYQSLAGDWAWASFDRAVCAHMRGDDNLALQSAEQLESVWRAMEAAIALRNRSQNKAIGAEVGYLRFIRPIKLLLIDQQRRAASTKLEPQGKIMALIADLENVDARQLGQPGGVDLSSDPRILSLVKMKSRAIKPLLRCLESDTRLTRSVGFHRDFFPGRNLISVQATAYVALSKILQRSFTEPQADGVYLSPYNAEDRQQLASRIRIYLKQRRETGSTSASTRATPK